MKLQDILKDKGTRVHTIRPEATLDDVVQTLVRHNIGSLIVTQGGEAGDPMLGIITERDILRACAARRAPFEQLHAVESMSVDLVVASPNDSVEDTMGLMTNRRIRHLPVTDQGELVGIVSIGDIVKAQHGQLTMENYYLKTYIQGDIEAPVAVGRPR